MQGLDCLSCDDATSFFCKLERAEILDVKRDSIGLKSQFWSCNHTCAEIAKNAIKICKTAEKIFKVKKNNVAVIALRLDNEMMGLSY